MRNRGADPTNREALVNIFAARKYADERTEEPLCDDAAVRRKDPVRQAMLQDREQAKRPVQVARRPSRSPVGGAERPMAPRQRDEGGKGPATGRPGPVAGSSERSARQQARERLREPALECEDSLYGATLGRACTLTAAERAELDAGLRTHRDYWHRVYEKLMLDAQATGRAMQHSPRIDNPTDWDAIASKSLDDYRSGRSLMDHLGAARLLDPATTGLLLGIRRGLIEETSATSFAEFVLIDMAVIAFANAMRVQSIIGNTALILESELFCQPTLRAKWRKKHGERSEEIDGLAIEEHVAAIRDRLLPAAERFHRMGRESMEVLGRLRQAPALSVEREEPIKIMFATP
jgi:hypothetical protein